MSYKKRQLRALNTKVSMTAIAKKSTILAILILLLLQVQSFAQLYPVPLQERIDSSKKVIVGKVLAANSYWEADSSNIYTAYTMEVICYTKNRDNNEFFDLILPGGVVGEDAQIDFPHIHLEIGYEYMVAVTEVDLYTLNRKHARSNRPSFRPFSYIQGILPLVNGEYKDYFDTTTIAESVLIDSIETFTSEQATEPDGTDWFPRDSFPISDGDIDDDGVLDIFDIDPSDPNSNSDGDSFTDVEETNGTTGFPPSDPLNACDPQPGSSTCVPIDLDNDNLYGNFPPTSTLFDPDDANICIPNNSMSFGCPPVDNDLDGLYANDVPGAADPDDNNPCLPQTGPFGIPIIADTYIDEANPTHNFGNSDTLFLSNEQGIEKRILFQMDVDVFTLPQHIPMDAYLTGTVFLSIYAEGLNGIVPEVSFYRILQPWEAGTGSTSGDQVSWSSAGNGVTWQPGGDIDPNPIYSGFITQPGWNQLDISPLLHESILNPNFGYMMQVTNPVSNSSYTLFSSASSLMPTLSIEPDPNNCTIPNPSPRQPQTFSNITLKNGAGETTNTFIAGTIEEEHEMVIQGSGFGNQAGYIQLPHAGSGGTTLTSLEYATDLIYWTDTEIRFKIPKNAGTGNMILLSKNQVTIGTAPITIKWSLMPLYYKASDEMPYRHRSHFVDRNEVGGYHFEISTSFAANTGAFTAFERALTTWQCATNVNWELGNNTTRKIGKDGVSVIVMSDTLDYGVLGVASCRYKGSGSTCPDFSSFWRVNEIDIAFADVSILPEGTNWNFSENAPAFHEYDFETIVLHELGHAHGLAHVIESSSVMHFSVRHGEMKRTIGTHELEGATYKMDHSTAANCSSRHDPMMELPNAPCATPIANRTTQVKVLLEGLYDATLGEMKSNLLDAGLIPLSQPFHQAPYHYTGTESVTTIPADIADWILLELRDPLDYNMILFTKAFFLKKDGSIVNLDGTTDIVLEGVVNGNYYISITHPSHLSIVSKTPHPVQQTATLYDFTSTAAAAMGIEQLKEKDGTFLMYSGDFDGNGNINGDDKNLWKQTLNAASINVYSPADANGSGVLNVEDYNLWKANLSKLGMIAR